jgi:hypothetical protein
VFRKIVCCIKLPKYNVELLFTCDVPLTMEATNRALFLNHILHHVFMGIPLLEKILPHNFLVN